MRLLLLVAFFSGLLGAQPLPYKISTAAGNYQIGDGGPATAASLVWPQSVAMDAAGNLYVGENNGARIRKITPDGKISTYAGNGIYGRPAEGAKATETNMTLNTGSLAMDSAGNLYVATENYWTVHKISPSGIITKFAGASCCSNVGKGDNGPALEAIVGWVDGLLADQAGNVYIAAANRVRKVDSKGIITLVAGTGEAGYSGDNGPATSAKLNYPNGLALDADGNLYIADYFNGAIRKVTTDGRISTYAGGYPTIDPVTRQIKIVGEARNVWIYGPVGMVFDKSGNMFVTANYGHRILKIAAALSGVAQVTSIAGTGVAGFSGDGGPATSAQLRGPQYLSLDAAGNLYFADYGNGRIRKIDMSSGTISTIAGTPHLAGDGGQAAAAQVYFPSGVASDGQGNLYIADSDNRRIRKVTVTGVISTVAGANPLDDGKPVNITSGPALERELGRMNGIASDRDGNIYVSDSSNYVIRKISTSGTMTVIAGTGGYANSPGDGVATQVGIYPHGGITVDASGNVYFTENNRVRKLTADGNMTTVAGNGTPGYLGDGGQAKFARINYPTGLVFDAKGNLLISDSDNHCIRSLSPDGIITTFAGTCASAGFSGDRGKASAARMYVPRGLAYDSAGNLFVIDSGNARIRQITPDGNIYTIAGTGVFGYSGDGGPALEARLGGGFAPIMGLTVVGKTVYFSDYYNHRVRQLIPVTPGALSIVSGDGQSAAVNTAVTSSLVVRVLDPDGAPMAGITVSFAVSAGAASLNVSSLATGVDGQAGVTVRMGNTAGPVKITATVAGLPVVTFNLTATPGETPVTPEPPAANPDTPAISSGGIAQNGFSVPAVRNVSPGAITSIFGTNFAASGSAPVSGALSGGRLGTKLAGICVTFGGVPAPVFAVSATQLTVQVPNVSPGTVVVQVVRNCGEANELKSNSMAVTAAAATPELLYLQTNADGNNPVAAVGAGGQWIGPEGLIPGIRLTPARAGDVIVLYGLGFGATNPGSTPGTPPAGAAATAAPVKVTIGGVELADSDVYYAGATPTYLGLYQINLKVPAGVRPGLQKVVVRVGGASSPGGGYLAIAE